MIRAIQAVTMFFRVRANATVENRRDYARLGQSVPVRFPVTRIDFTDGTFHEITAGNGAHFIGGLTTANAVVG